MTNLTPEQRPDKNGKIVTRHVRPNTGTTNANRLEGVAPTAQKMDASEVSSATESAATVGLIELLTQPEFGKEWVVEMMSQFNIEPTEENIEATTELVYARAKALSETLVDQLPTEVQHYYR